jgi:hypothetical protein
MSKGGSVLHSCEYKTTSPPDLNYLSKEDRIIKSLFSLSAANLTNRDAERSKTLSILDRSNYQLHFDRIVPMRHCSFQSCHISNFGKELVRSCIFYSNRHRLQLRKEIYIIPKNIRGYPKIFLERVRMLDVDVLHQIVSPP